MLVIQKLEQKGWRTIVSKPEYALSVEDAFDEIISIISCSTPYTFQIGTEKEINYGYETFPQFIANIKTIDSHTVDLTISDMQQKGITKRLNLAWEKGNPNVTVTQKAVA